MTSSQEDLARALEHLAEAARAAPTTVIGLNVSASSGGGTGGTVTGMHVSVTGSPGGGNVTGVRVSASSSDKPLSTIVAEEALELAKTVRAGGTNKSAIQSILEKAKPLGTTAMNAAISAVVSALVKSAS